jgi:hypothetical protein
MNSSGANTRRWWQNADLAAALLLVLLGILFFADFLFSAKNFYFRDILSFHFPLRKLLIDSYARGEIPLWNSHVYLGQPMLANPNYMALYPSNLLHTFLPFNYAFKLHLILHPILAGLGLYFLQRRLGIAPVAAFGGSAIYQFSGTLLSFLNLYNIVPAVALIPWVAWAFLGALDRTSLRTLLFGALLGLQIIAFEPTTAQCSLLLLGGLAVFRLMQSEDRRKAATSIVLTLAMGGGFALALAAAQVMPTLELVSRSARGAGYDFRSVSRWSMHPADLINVIVPNYFGEPYRTDLGNHWGEAYHEGREGYLVSFFVGSGSLLLALFSCVSERKKLRSVLWAITLLSVVLALGKYTPVNRWLFDYVPFFRLGRFPAKYFLLSTLSLSLLASLGLESLRAGSRDPRKNRSAIGLAVLGGALAAVLVGVWLYGQLYPSEVEAWIRSQVSPDLITGKDFPAIRSQLLTSIRSTGFLLLLSSGLLLAWALRPRHMGKIVGLAILLLIAELAPANLRLSPSIPGDLMDFVPEINSFLQNRGGNDIYRVAPPLWIGAEPDIRRYAPNRSAAWLSVFDRRCGEPFYGIINGIQYSLYLSVDDLNTRESDELLRAYLKLPYAAGLNLWQKLNTPAVLTVGEIQDPRLQPLASFNTDSILKANLYWLRDSLPRAYFATRVVPAASIEDARGKLLQPELSLAGAVILEGGEKSQDVLAGGSVEVREYGNHRVVCEAKANITGYLVLLDSFYPGWRAYVDGQEVEILRANYAFRAVRIPEGDHRVEFRYRPRSFYIGFSITCLAFALGTIVVLSQLRRKYGTRHVASTPTSCLG